jgi:hypothetical protein
MVRRRCLFRGNRWPYGFTGKGLWIDFSRGIAWALLTNRVHPTRRRETGIAELRCRVGDLVVGACG